MNKKQTNERVKTRYEGVYQRASRVKRHQGKPDICYSIDYHDPLTGKRVRETIGWLSKEITAAYAHAIRNARIERANKARFKGLAPLDEKDIPPLAKAWTLYQHDWLEMHGIKSLKNDTGIWQTHLADHRLAATRLHHISAKDIEELAAGIVRSGRSPQTARHVVGLVRRVLNKAIDWDIWDGPSPFQKRLKLPRVQNERRRYLTPAQAFALLENLRAINVPLWQISLLALHCGMRFSEIASRRWTDIDFENGLIFIDKTKTETERYAIMTPAAREMLEAMRPGDRSALLFPDRDGGQRRQVSKTWDRVIEALEFNLGITDLRDKVVFHTLRHTFATWLSRTGSQQVEVKGMMGHASLASSERYTHFMQDSRFKAAARIDEIFNSGAHPEPQ